MDKAKLKSILEGLIFTAREPLSLNGFNAILSDLNLERKDLKEALDELVDDYNNNEAHGLQLREIQNGWQFVTKESVALWVGKLDVSKPKHLSQPSLETLAIIAYRQPTIRAEIENIRGVDSGGVLRTLLERGLIKILGRREEAGQPLIYGTTPAFLELFHLNTLEELPSMRDIEGLVAERQKPQEEDASILEGEDFIPSNETVLEMSREECVEDEKALEELESQIKAARRLEQEIFPKVNEGESQPSADMPQDVTEPVLSTTEE